jgi:hypothetical protein
VQTPSSPSSASFDSGADAQTMPGSLVGTPAYMSPEQAFGREIDFRSDIYSPAVVAYSLASGQLPFSGKASELFEYHEHGHPAAPADIRKIPRDLSDVILTGLARNPSDRPPSAIAFTRRFHNALDAEFLALRRSKAFLLQHLGACILLLTPGYGVLISVTALLDPIAKKLLPFQAGRTILVPLAAAALFVFSDNLLRAGAALIAADEQVRVRRFLSFRVSWKLIRMLPVLARTQIQALFFIGPGWIIGDCLWPVICVVEKLSGKPAIQRSRELMTGLRSAGRALAIRHLALPAVAVAAAARGMLSLRPPNLVIAALWFPVFALFAAAPLFLYDRTSASESGPLLQLDRTPEVRTTARPLSPSSMIWLGAGLIYVLYEPLKKLLFSGR